ncbi:MAG: hypothetical protein LUD81_03590, partial [Clostridiales bacterium]|nr:hypothetical protein [Clostridiales bacterium]
MPDAEVIKALKEKYNDGYKHGETPTYTQWYNDADMAAFESNVSEDLVKNMDAYHKALDGDYSQFEKLSGAARIYIASKYMKDNYEMLYQDVTHGHASINNLWGIDRNMEEGFNPAFRLALAVVTGDEDTDKMLRDFDDRYSKKIMEDTLAPLGKEQFDKIYEEEKKKIKIKTETIKESDSEEEAAAKREANAKREAMRDARANDAAAIRTAENMEKQVSLAKILFMSHLGRVYTKEENREAEDVEEKEYKGDVTGLFSHCTRVCVVLPRGENTPLLEDISGVDKNGISSTYKRGAATHGISSRTYKGENGEEVDKGFKEEKVFAGLANQYGMDVPIGGLYNAGVPAAGGQGALIKNDGSCGHMYMHLHKGGAYESAAMLIGFESDSPSAPGNQQGHKHSITATREKMSSFSAQRISSIGADYGGRMVDLSKADPQKLMSVIDDFEASYRGMLMTAMENSNLEGRQNVSENKNAADVKHNLEMVNSLLSGKVMTGGDLVKMFDNMNIKNKDIRDVLTNTKGADEQSLSQVSRAETNQLRKAD